MKFLKQTFASKPAFTFYWSLTNQTIVFLADSLAGNLGLLDLPNEAVVVLGLLLNGVTKYFNKKSQSR